MSISFHRIDVVSSFEVEKSFTSTVTDHAELNSVLHGFLKARTELEPRCKLRHILRSHSHSSCIFKVDETVHVSVKAAN